jgi:hypothetical protein
VGRVTTISLPEEEALERQIESMRRLGSVVPRVVVRCATCGDTYTVAAGHRGSAYCKMVATKALLVWRGLDQISRSYEPTMKQCGVPMELHLTGPIQGSGYFNNVKDLEPRLWVPAKVASALRAKDPVPGHTNLFDLKPLKERKKIIYGLVETSLDRWKREGIGS